MSDSITLLIDGDFIIYTAGFASQHTDLFYEKALRIRNGRVQVKGERFLNLTDLKAHIPDYDPKRVYQRTIVDELSHVLHTVNQMLVSYTEAVAEKFSLEVEPIVLIDGDGNFRSRLATIRPYKGNRHPNSQPLAYNDIRQHLMRLPNTIVCHGHETDDAISIYKHQAKDRHEKVVICGVDKDLLQIPGHHYNPRKGFRYISPGTGLRNKYMQCLTGDAVDNIMGVPGVGPVKAASLLPDVDDEAVLWRHTVKAFAHAHKKDPNIYRGLTPEQAALETMRLVHLQTYHNELWEPPNEG